MSYEIALKNAWEDLAKVSRSAQDKVALLGDAYTVDSSAKTVISDSCNVPAKDFLAILILHYLAAISKTPYVSSLTWISFKEIEGGEIYYPAYREGAIIPLIHKYGTDPAMLNDVVRRLPGRVVSGGDAAIELETFKDLFVRVILWKGDEEFDPDANILFDKNISTLFTMEDIAVFARLVAHRLSAFAFNRQ